MPDTFQIADIVELQTWAANKAYSEDTLEKDLKDILPSEEHDNAEAYARETFEIIKERAKLLGSAYPFDFDGAALTPNTRSANSSYLFCLGLEYFDNVTLDLRAREFEAIVKEAAEKYFNGEAVRIGAPWRTQEITDYSTLLQRVSDLIPDLGPPTRDAAPGGGDAGWDVVVVNNFNDKKTSRIIALGNCATGKTDWRQKGAEAQPTLFWSFFRHPPQIENVCLTFIAVPFLMTHEDKLRKISSSCIAFDRIRLCENVETTSTNVMAWLNQQKQSALNIPLL